MKYMHSHIYTYTLIYTVYIYRYMYGCNIYIKIYGQIIYSHFDIHMYTYIYVRKHMDVENELKCTLIDV